MRGPRRPRPDEIEEVYHGYPVLRFVVNGKEAVMIKPHSRLLGRPWIWQTEYQECLPAIELELLRRGFTYLYADLGDSFGSPQALKQMDAVYEKSQEFGLSQKVILEAYGRGAFSAYRWAAKRPSKIAAIYADAPACDIKSWPGGKGTGPGSPADWAEFLRIFTLTQEQALTFAESPIDVLSPLVKYQVPLLHVCPQSDEITPTAENTGVLAERYRALGGEIEIITRAGGHHPHGLEDPASVVAFICKVAEDRICPK